jgi:2-dehydro-3-deoxyphosphogluconate aldolase/(4S)-4-hydroxy-2-oxoglutarate aldolase
VLRADNVGLASELAWACIAGGIRAVEFTTSIPGWESLLQVTCRDCGDNALFGLGTVVDSEDVSRAVDLGACFIVSPYVSRPVMDAATVEDIAIIPGALTPTEIAEAYELGADMVKIFPASLIGGPKYIKALLGPMSSWELVPTGGVTPENAVDYFRAGAVAVGIGTNIAPEDKVEAGDWDAVTAAVRAFLAELNSQLKDGDP